MAQGLLAAAEALVRSRDYPPLLWRGEPRAVPAMAQVAGPVEQGRRRTGRLPHGERIRAPAASEYLSLFRVRSARQLRAASDSDSAGRRDKTVYTTVSLLLDVICEYRLPGLTPGVSAIALTMAFLVACGPATGLSAEALQFILPDPGDRLDGGKILANLSLLTNKWARLDLPAVFHQLTHLVAREWFRETWEGWHTAERPQAPGIFASFAGGAESLLGDACNRLIPRLSVEIRTKDDWDRIGLNCGIAVVVLGVLDILSFACISRDLAACLGQLTRAAAIAAPYLFGRPEQIRRLDWLWDLGRRIGSSQLALVCRGCRAMVLPEFIDLPATKREIEAVLEEFVADNPDDRLFRVKMLRQLAGMQYEMAKFDDAIACIDRAITELERNQIASPFPRLDLMCLKANALSRRGDLDEAISFYEEAEALAEAHSIPLVMAEAAYCRADDLAKRGRLREASEVLLRVIRDLAPLAYQQRLLGSIFNSYGLVQAALGHQNDALRYLTSGRALLARQYGPDSDVHSKQLVDVATFLMMAARAATGLRRAHAWAGAQHVRTVRPYRSEARSEPGLRIQSPCRCRGRPPAPWRLSIGGGIGAVCAARVRAS